MKKIVIGALVAMVIVGLTTGWNGDHEAYDIGTNPKGSVKLDRM